MVAACGARTSLGDADQQSVGPTDAAAGTSVDGDGGIATREDRAPEPDGVDGAEAASTFARPSCGTVAPAAHEGCSAIHELTLSNPSVVDAGASNGVSPGQTATIGGIL